MSEARLYQVTLPWMTASFLAHKGRVIEAAPILRWTIGKTVKQVRAWVRTHKGGRVRMLPQRRERQSRKEKK